MKPLTIKVGADKVLLHDYSISLVLHIVYLGLLYILCGESSLIIAATGVGLRELGLSSLSKVIKIFLIGFEDLFCRSYD